MALLFADSFERYGMTPNYGRDALLAGEYLDIVGTANIAQGIKISNTQARTGVYALWVQSSSTTGSTTHWIRRVLNPEGNTFGIAMGIYMSNLPTHNDYLGFSFYNASGVVILTVHISPDGSLIVRNGVWNSAIIASSDVGVLTAQAFNHLEMKFTFDNIVGSFEFRVNGVNVLRQENLPLAAVAPTSFSIGATPTVSTPTRLLPNVYYDDLAIWDDSGDQNNDFLGPARVLEIFPAEDTAQDDWSIVGASDGYAAVNNVPPDGDTTYISGAVVGDQSEFVLEELPPEVEAIAGIYIPVMAKLAQAGEGNVQVSLVSNNVPSLGEDVPLTTSYLYWGSIIEKNVDTDAPWTRNDLNGAVIRVEKTK